MATCKVTFGIVEEGGKLFCFFYILKITLLFNYIVYSNTILLCIFNHI